MRAVGGTSNSVATLTDAFRLLNHLVDHSCSSCLEICLLSSFRAFLNNFSLPATFTIESYNRARQTTSWWPLRRFSSALGPVLVGSKRSPTTPHFASLQVSFWTGESLIYTVP
jgi:hypothetical protein